MLCNSRRDTFKTLIMMRSLLITLLAALFVSCDDSNDLTNNNGGDANIVTAVQLEKDKALYMPGEQVSFKADKELGSDVYIRYSYLGDVIEEVPASGKTWTWTPPQEDFRGYMVEIVSKGEDHENYMGSIAVDVSSDWKKFPRYGFLSHYGPMSEEAIKKVIHNLNRHHINGVQYQDWHYKHHKPLAGTPDNPAETWKEIANRTNSKQTIDQYIAEGHEKGMKSIFYNLCFGVLSDGASDGVQEEWYIFKDKFRNNKDYHGLPKPYFWSDIYLTDPGHSGWLNYMAQQNDDVYQVFDFDGFQIDQLGNRGTVYDYNGNVVNLPEQYLKFIDAMKSAQPEKRLIMNAVSEYGKEQIAQGDIDFFYNEVWGDTPKFTDLERIIHENNAFRSDLKTVFAAYMNYNVADGQGYFNTPGVLLTDAVMFAFGGSHLELGEHMLGKEYFPNNNLQMKGDLQRALVNYYDFMVGYQNLLRDGGTFNTESVDISCTNGRMDVAAWPPQTGKVASVAKIVENKQVIHLLNLSEANSFDWRDINGTQPEPAMIEDAGMKLRTDRPIKKIWVASPDVNGGVAQEVDFNQNAVSASFKLPGLKYWGMIVVEY